ncbi:MAG: hypothetical protein GSR80_001809 [Desulfurococcales archaeon]|nr:hypothetical protein [Desulfurococcales archaeon]
MGGSSAALRLSEALRRGLLGIVVDSRLEDVRLVERELAELGLLGLVERWSRGHLTVFYVNPRRLRSACLYERCGSKPKTEVDVCVAECVREKLQSLGEKLALLGEGVA